MYTVIKRMEVSAAHSLKLSYRSKCENLHGHNWIITVYCRSTVCREKDTIRVPRLSLSVFPVAT